MTPKITIQAKILDVPLESKHKLKCPVFVKNEPHSVRIWGASVNDGNGVFFSLIENKNEQLPPM